MQEATYLGLVRESIARSKLNRKLSSLPPTFQAAVVAGVIPFQLVRTIALGLASPALSRSCCTKIFEETSTINPPEGSRLRSEPAPAMAACVPVWSFGSAIPL